jgi:ribonuclease D
MIITKQKELDELCQSLAAQPFIMVDTEFLREKTYFPKLCLIQVCGPDKKAYAIDPLVKKLDLKPFLDILLNSEILKVFHAARQDLEIFFQLCGKVPSPLFDTQIAAMVCGYGDSVGYESLVRNITGGQLDKSVQFTDWSRRPLTDRQLEYALGDVTHLCDIYLKLSAELTKTGRMSWVFEEEKILADPATYVNDPYEMWRKIKIKSPKRKTLALLRELAAWREIKAQEKNLPRSWILKDETLADMAAQSPKTPEELEKIRNFPKEAAKGDTGAQILSLLEKVRKMPSADYPDIEKKSPIPQSVSGVVDILRMLLKVQASESGVAAKLIADSDDLEAIAMQDDPDTLALKGWRYELFGREALALKNGEIAIGMRGNKITKFKVHPQTTSEKET